MEGRLLLVVVFLQGVLCQRVCEWKTCRECIRDPNLCMWCATENFNGTSRCRPVTQKDDNWCSPEYLQNPLSNIKVGDSKDFSSEVGHMVQIKPQSYNLKLRVGQEQTFSFSYKASVNFPVDLYFLFDASNSMKRMKNDLVNQTNNIFETISNKTKDVYMGLGTFIDKNLIPFNNKISANQTYSFKHELKLTKNIKLFNNKLSHLNFGSNADDPESGLEGIAQAVACKNITGWRKQSRKILVLMTDQAYHAAGDGKAAGIIRPYDGGCYLDKNGYYTKEKEMDYPSVGIINYMVTKEEIKILFVSSFSDQTVYNTLATAITESEAMSYQPKAITSMLDETYEKISQQIKLKLNLTDEDRKHFEITFDPNCDYDNCKVTPGQEMNFTGKILLQQYFNKNQLYIKINPIGLNDEIVLNVTVLSDCACSQYAEINSTRCHNIGNWSCGVCECPDIKFGPDCGCTGNSSTCSPPGSDQICSGHGTCNPCGICKCAEGYEGKYCEYQNNNCLRDNAGNLCSGHGTCLDGKCTCIGEWTRPACDCTTSKTTCISDGMECNNRGHCICGICACDPPAKWDARTYDSSVFCKQTQCFDCHSKQCRHLTPCINCLNEGGSCQHVCGDTLFVQNTKFVDMNGVNTTWQNCTHIQVNFGCYSDFKYVYNDNNTMTLVVLDTSCAQSQMYIGVISVIILVAIGIATLLAWKLLTNARDRREYEAFLKSSQEGDSLRINPTYTAPTTTYMNPAFENSTEQRKE
ncbi:integrin beta pat-3-like [Cydia splendana]|uniref:integrin beta pat-3-like n=1 Tax=Cydia splendana TaxID=1100963 RepID=UPI0021326481